jgi:hypothetical protein
MDIAELSERTGINVRKLRYCLDHDLIPGLPRQIHDVAVGRARRFAEDAGLGIVCASLLQELGLPHPKIRLFLQSLLNTTMKGGASVLAAVLEHGWPAEASLGDGDLFRVVVWASMDDKKMGKDSLHDSRWRGPDNKIYKEDPRVRIVLDIGAIWRQVYTSGR